MKESDIFSRLSPLGRRKFLELGAGGLSVSALLAACGGSASANPSSSSSSSTTEGNFPEHPTWNFVFVNHVTTNPFFVPTQYGIQDACALLGCKYQ